MGMSHIPLNHLDTDVDRLFVSSPFFCKLNWLFWERQVLALL